MLKNFFNRYKFSRFLVSGIAAVAVEYSFFWLLQDHMFLLFAHSLSFLAGLVVSFTLNRTWVFRVRQGKKQSQFGRYALIAFINLVLGNGIIALLVVAGMPQMGAKVIVMAVIALWNFFIFGRFVFAEKPTSSSIE